MPALTFAEAFKITGNDLLLTASGDHIRLMGGTPAHLLSPAFGRVLTRSVCADCGCRYDVHPELAGASPICADCHTRRLELCDAPVCGTPA